MLRKHKQIYYFKYVQHRYESILTIWLLLHLNSSFFIKIYTLNIYLNDVIFFFYILFAALNNDISIEITYYLNIKNLWINF